MDSVRIVPSMPVTDPVREAPASASDTVVDPPTSRAQGAPSTALVRSATREIAAAVVAVRRALGTGDANELNARLHPRALQNEQAWLRRSLGRKAAGFWSRVSHEIEAVRYLDDEVAEVYELVRDHETSTTLRVQTLARWVDGSWRVIDSAPATDEKIRAVLLRGSPPDQAIDAETWTRRWQMLNGPTARLRMNGTNGVLEHPERGWTAIVRTGSGKDVARALSATGSAAELLEKQPAATVVSLVPSLNARQRTDQVRWITRVVASLGGEDASSVWLPTSAKVVPFASFRAMAAGKLELASLAALWLRTQRQRGAWVSRGMTVFMLPEIEVSTVGVTPATVHQLMRDAVGRLLRHHRERIRFDLDARACAVPAFAPRLYERSEHGVLPIEPEILPTAIEVHEDYTIGEVACALGRGRRGPRPGESYGRWGSVAVLPKPAWWARAA